MTTEAKKDTMHLRVRFRKSGASLLLKNLLAFKKFH